MNEPHITITDLRDDLPNITDRLIDGDTFIVTRYGMPLAALTPIAEYRRLTTQEH
jgi:prevent-host-death family protein